VREVDQVGDAEDEREADGDQRVDIADRQAVDDLVDDQHARLRGVMHDA
jgi:hypothetical protein